MKFHSPREWSNYLITAPQKRAIGADFAAQGRPELSGREQHWSAPVPLTAVQPNPWLRPATKLPPKAATKTNQQTKPGNKKHKRIQKNLDDLSRLSGYLGAKQQRTIKTTNRNKQKNSNKGKKYTNSQFTDAKVYSYSHAWGAGHSLSLSTSVWKKTRWTTGKTHQTKQAARKEEAQGGEAEEDRGETRRRTHAALAATEVMTWRQA